MAFAFAGFYAEVFENENRALLRNEPVTVYLPGTTTKATLYSSRTKATTVANPFSTDEFGNGSFFADPGFYDLFFNGATELCLVNPDPEEKASQADLDAEEAARDAADSAEAAARAAADVALQDSIDAEEAARTAADAIVWDQAVGNAVAAISATPIVAPGATGAWDESIREPGNVVHDGAYRMLYSGHQGAYAGNNVHLGLATSVDGVTWTKAGQLTLGRASEDPYLLRVGTTWHLFCEDKEEVPFRAIRKYHSDDLATWVDDGQVLQPVAATWESQDVSSPVVWVEDGTWHMLYEGRQTAGQQGAVGLATSADGTTWTREPSNPVFEDSDIAWADRVVPDDTVVLNGVRYLFSHAWDGVAWRLSVAVSPGPLTAWRDLSGQPVPVLGALTLGNVQVVDTDVDGLYVVYDTSTGIHRARFVPYSAFDRRDNVACMLVPDAVPDAGVVIGNAFGDLQMVNSTSAAGEFAPLFRGNSKGSTRPTLLQGRILTADDTGTTGVVVMDARRVDGTDITTRPLFVLRNRSTTRISVAPDGTITLTGGDVVAATAGKGLKVKEGANAKMGVATLVAGAVTVNTTAVTATSRIFLTAQNTAGTPGELSVTARTAGTSFTIGSLSALDTRQVAWMIVEPA